MRAYAGIGSREAPASVLAAMECIGKRMAERGWELSSGNCKGPDQAFARGANSINPSKTTLWLPWATYEKGSVHKDNTVYDSPTDEAISLSRLFHPNWLACTQAVQKMHGRNTHIVLGLDLLTPVNFVICWTPSGRMVGGTSQAIRIAMSKSIPIYNIAVECQLRTVMSLIYS